MSSMTSGLESDQVFAGVDTHKASHQVAVIDADGREVASHEFTTSRVGCDQLARWLGRWPIARVGVEQTGTYGSGLARVLSARGYQVIEVDRPDRWVRARQGKSDPIDAVMAAHAVRTGRAQGAAKDRAGVVESIRLLHLTRVSAVKDRAEALTRLGGMAITVPAGLREQLGTSNRQIVIASLRLRPDPDRLGEPLQAAKRALRSLARRISDLDAEINSLDADLARLVGQVAPRLLARPQVGVNIAAQLLITAGQNIDRIGTEAKFARLTGIAPIPASSGQTHRMRLHRGGDRQANRAVHLVAIGRLKQHQPAIDYYQRRQREGLSKTDAIRAMKRLIARELYGALKADLGALDRL